MSNTTTVYIPTPVSDPPTKSGWYNCYAGDEFLGQDYFSDGAFPDKSVTHWLRKVEVTNDSPVQKAIEFFKHDPESIGRWNGGDIVEMLRPYLVQDQARSAHIKQLEEDCRLYEAEIKAFQLSLTNADEKIKDLESIRDKQLLDIAAMAKEISDLKGEREKVASDAWDAAISYYEEGGGPATDSTPDKETYLKSLNTQQ